MQSFVLSRHTLQYLWGWSGVRMYYVLWTGYGAIMKCYCVIVIPVGGLFSDLTRKVSPNITLTEWLEVTHQSSPSVSPRTLETQSCAAYHFSLAAMTAGHETAELVADTAAGLSADCFCLRSWLPRLPPRLSLDVKDLSFKIFPEASIKKYNRRKAFIKSFISLK